MPTRFPARDAFRNSARRISNPSASAGCNCLRLSEGAEVEMACVGGEVALEPLRGIHQRPYWLAGCRSSWRSLGRTLIPFLSPDGLGGAGAKVGGGRRPGNRTNLPDAQAMGVAANRKAADAFAANVLPIVRQIQASGATTFRAIAEALNNRGVRTARGGAWHDSTVRNLLARTG
jgi:hypothetical protein